MSIPGLSLFRDRGAPRFSLAALLLFLISAVLLGHVLFDPAKSWVQSDYAVHLPRSMQNGTALQPLSDLLNTIATSASLDQRARFLPYFLITIDQKLRLMLEELLPLLPAFNPVLWLLHGIVGPFLLFRYVATATESRAAGWTALAVYLTSPGFLYVFTMNWLPQKALVNLGFIVVLWLGARIAARLQNGAPLFGGAPLPRAMLLAAMLALFLTDEYGFFCIILVVVMFWWRFVRVAQDAERSLPSTLGNLGVLLTPVGVFAVLMLAIVPLLARKLYGVHFSYSHALATGAHRAAEGGSGAWLRQILIMPAENLVNLLGISFVPYDLSGLSGAFPPHFGVQSLGAAHAVAIAALLGAVGVALRRASRDSADAPRRRIWPAIAAYVLLVSFVSWLALAHQTRMINGFYYGGPIAVAFAVLIAFVARYATGRARIGAFALVGWIVVVQYLNFDRLNAIWSTGSDAYVAKLYRDYLPMADPRDKWTMADIAEIQASTRRGELDANLERRPLPPRLFYLVAEQCVKNSASSARCASLIEMLRRSGGSP
jgi:hypothetical protein